MEESPWTNVIASCIEAERKRRRIDHALLAFSGGPDSTFLLHHFLFVAAKLDFGFTAVHVDHGLRGREGTRDRKHCEKVTAANDVDLIVQQLKAPKGASETWARRQRYEALLQVARDENAQIVVTGHHLDDDLETILLKLSRGVRPSRMFGMKTSRRLAPGTDVRLVRPLLGIERHEIETWIEENEVPCVRDSTNEDLRIPRNRVRHEVIPALDEVSPPGWKRRIVATFDQAARRLRARERVAEHALLVTLLQGAGLKPTDARLAKLKEELLAGRAHTILGTRFGFEIQRRGDRIEVVAPGAGAPPAPEPPAAVPSERPPAAPLERPRPTRSVSRPLPQAATQTAPARRPPQPRPSEREEKQNPAPPKRHNQAEIEASQPPPPEPARLLEPGSPVETPLGKVTLSLVGPADAAKRIETLRKKRDRSAAVLQLPEVDPKKPPRVEIRAVHEYDRMQTLGFPHVRRIWRAMQSRGIGVDERDRAHVVLIDGRPAWVLGFEIAHDYRFRKDEDEGRGTFLVLEVD